ncbi:MAG: hypothetical protein HKL90_11550 [Elusimicrobia bacterium]|nr:hypothetical protein [Elusimicrobiota bacterium]
MKAEVLRRADVARLAALAAAWILFFVLVDPRGAGSTVFRLGLIAVGGFGAALVYVLARRWRASVDAALLAALTLAFSPVYAALSANARADAAASVLALGGLFAFLRGRVSRAPSWLAACSALVSVAGIFRPEYFLCAAAGAAVLRRERRLGRREAAALLGPAVVAAVGALILGHLRGGAWGGVDAAAFGVFGGVEIAALCLAPLAVAAAQGTPRREMTRAEKTALAFIAGAALVFWFRARGLDPLPGIVSRWGLGVLDLAGVDGKSAGWWASAGFWYVLAAVATASSVQLARRALETARAAYFEEIAVTALFCGVPCAAALAMGDARGLLMALPVAAAAAAAGLGGRAWRLAPAFGAALGLALVSSAGLEDYFAWSRARAAALNAVAAHGARPQDIAAGRVVVSFTRVQPRPGLLALAAFPYRSILAPEGAAVYLFGETDFAGAPVTPAVPPRR